MEKLPCLSYMNNIADAKSLTETFPWRASTLYAFTLTQSNYLLD